MDTNDIKKTEIQYPKDKLRQLNKKCKKIVQDAYGIPSKEFLVGKYLIEGTNQFPLDMETGILFMEHLVTKDCIEAVIFY